MMFAVRSTALSFTSFPMSFRFANQVLNLSFIFPSLSECPERSEMVVL